MNRTLLTYIRVCSVERCFAWNAAKWVKRGFPLLQSSSLPGPSRRGYHSCNLLHYRGPAEGVTTLAIFFITGAQPKGFSTLVIFFITGAQPKGFPLLLSSYIPGPSRRGYPLLGSHCITVVYWGLLSNYSNCIVALSWFRLLTSGTLWTVVTWVLITAQ